MKQRCGVCVVFCVAISCGPAIKFTPPPPSDLTRTLGVPAPDYVGVEHVSKLSGYYWRKVIQEALNIVRSADFALALTRYAVLDPKVGSDPTTGPATLDAYLGKSPAAGQLVTQYVLTDAECGSQTASTVLLDAPDNGPTARFARTVLNRCTVERAMHRSEAEFACAINTAAHEWTHAVVLGTEQLYQDRGHKADPSPLVSYTVGAVAQCVYLAKHDRIAMTDIASCVDAVGTHSFDPTSCTDRWTNHLAGRR